MKWKTKKERRESSVNALLLAGVEDTEATIRAIDTKASIALVAHGFIFTATLTVLTHLGHSFDSASAPFRAVVVGLIVLGVTAFFGSVLQIVRCVRPTPWSAIPALKSRNLFFIPTTASPLLGAPSVPVSREELVQKAIAATSADITDELVAELIKVSAIRARKVSLSSSGLGLLGLEIAVVVVLFATLGIHQLTVWVPMV
jgi:hypothetical protein